MAIKLHCPNNKCKKGLSLDPKLAGRKVACPACKQHIQIPTAEALGLHNNAGKVGEDVKVTEADLEKMAEEMAAERKAEAARAMEAIKIKFNCPQCDEVIEADLKLSGKQTPCPHCRRIVKVPKSDQAVKQDWREKEIQGPSLAKKEEVKLEGEWGTQGMGRVSVEALHEAKALPKQRVKLTPWQWTKRGILALLVISAAFFGWRMLENYRWSSIENGAIIDITNNSKRIPLELQPFANLHVAEYRAKFATDDTGLRDAATSFRTALQQAGTNDPLVGWALARCAFPLQLESLLFTVDTNKSVQTVDDLAVSMKLASEGEPRWLLVSRSIRPILAKIKAQPDQVKKLSDIIQNLSTRVMGTAVKGAGDKLASPSGGEDISERLAFLSAYGVELHLADLKPEAVSIAKDVRSRFRKEFQVPRILPMLQQLCGQPDLEVNKSGEQAVREGKLLAFTLLKQDDQAMALYGQNNVFSDEHMMMLIELATCYMDMTGRGTDTQGRLTEAFERAKDTVQGRDANWKTRLWGHFRICELTALAGDGELGLKRAEQLQLPAFAKSLISRAAKQNSTGFDLPNDPNAAAMLSFELARKLTPEKGTDARSWANGLSEPARFFARLGVAMARKESAQK